MGIYEQLNHPYRQIVDRLVAYARLTDWHTCHRLLSQTYAALDRGRDRFPGIEPSRDFSHIVGAMIERLDAPPVDDIVQAVIYAVSAEEEHRKASQAWFDRHPTAFDAIWRSPPDGDARLH